MKIGIVSDSHGLARTLRSAVEELVARGAEAIVHCGDIGSEACLEALGQARVAIYAVAGNMDRHAERLAEAARRCGVHFGIDAVLLPLGGGHYLAVTHGNNPAIVQMLLGDEHYPFLCVGHTHKPLDEHVGHTHVINPGALRHAGVVTVALLDTETDTVVHIEIR